MAAKHKARREIASMQRRFRPAIIVGPLVAVALSTALGIALFARTKGTDGLSIPALRSLTREELSRVDVAALNLACAEGLPGGEGLDTTKLLAPLDRWADRVRRETERHIHRLQDPTLLAHYKGSEAVYRMEMLCQVLQEDLGVRYNPQRIWDVDFRNSRDLFIHGLVDSSNGGTCLSMPVVYTAIARRLGYPVYLVRAKGHVFCRWDGRGERWNIEATSTGGMDTPPDEYYRNWPERISDEEVQRGEYLVNLDAPGEFALFLAARGHCLLDIGRVSEAADAYKGAHRLDPSPREYKSFITEAARRSQRH